MIHKNTVFKDAIVPVKDPGDAGWASQSNGLDVLDGRAGTPGIMKETTLVDVSEGPKAGSSLMGAGGSLGSQTGRTSKDLA